MEDVKTIKDQLNDVMLVVVHVDVKPDRVDDFIKATIKSRNSTKEEKGCIDYSIFKVIGEDYKYTLSEMYETTEAFEAHKKTEHFLEWREAVEDMTSVPRASYKHRYVYDEADLNEIVNG